MPNTDPLIIERIFDAPIGEVWKAWSEPERTRKWWGPGGWTCPMAKIDFRVGGRYHMSMKGPMPPDNKEAEVFSTGVYKEIVPMKKIVCTDSFADAEGNAVSSEVYGMKDFPESVDVEITFQDLGSKTKMTLHHYDMPDYMKEDARQGWSTSFDKLEKLVEGKT